MDSDHSADFVSYDYYYEFDTANMLVKLKTIEPRNCWIVLSLSRPYWLELWHEKRGTKQLHDSYWRFPTHWKIQQNEPGLTTEHNFTIPDLVHCTQIFWLFIGNDGVFWAALSSPFFEAHVLLSGAPPLPQPTLVPYQIGIATTLWRQGNRYSQYAQGTYYAVVPQPSGISVWRFDGAAFVRIDQANEPGPPFGSFTDVDSRMRTTTDHIAIVSKCRNNATNQIGLSYHAFDTLTNTWVNDEQIAAVPNSAHSSQSASLAIDDIGVIHVVYDRYTGTHPTIWYIQGIPGVWAGNLEVISPLFRDNFKTTAHFDLVSHDFHVACNSGNRNYWNRRTSAAVWFGETQIPRGVYSGQDPSIMNTIDFPHVCFQSPAFDVTHAWGTPPVNWADRALAGNTWYHSMIASHLITPNLAIIYRAGTPKPTYITAIQGDPWGAETLIWDIGINQIVSNFHFPDIVTCIWSISAGGWTQFYAFRPAGF